MGEGPERDVEGIPEQEECGHRKHEAAQPRTQLLEFGAGLHGEKLLPGGGNPLGTVGFWHRGLLTVDCEWIAQNLIESWVTRDRYRRTAA
ncbi:hypothetical protein GCM10009856_15260 [Mycolicibacterium llatzerense]